MGLPVRVNETMTGSLSCRLLILGLLLELKSDIINGNKHSYFYDSR
ncbi:hypothetical protein PAAL109150_19575 [Paenibacillus alkaliterrae]